MESFSKTWKVNLLVPSKEILEITELFTNFQYGGKFIGYFKDDERNGPGIFEWPDGDRYEGSWEHGSR